MHNKLFWRGGMKFQPRLFWILKEVLRQHAEKSYRPCVFLQWELRNLWIVKERLSGSFNCRIFYFPTVLLVPFLQGQERYSCLRVSYLPIAYTIGPMTQRPTVGQLVPRRNSPQLVPWRNIPQLVPWRNSPQLVPWRNSPQLAKASSLSRFHDHTQTQHTR